MGIFNSKSEIQPFKRRKLLHEFYTFIDVNKNGVLEWKDFELAKKKVCDMGGWKPGMDKYASTTELFKTLWMMLQDKADTDCDGKVSEDEWLQMWKRHYEKLSKCKKGEKEEMEMPVWLESYVQYKFDMFDRTGNGLLDADEFEYVLGDYGVPPKDARTAFLLFSQNNDVKVDREYFRTLTIEYFLSDEESALGNFITGKLDFSSDVNYAALCKGK